MLAGELALAGVDVAIVERRASQDLPARAQAVCTHAPSRSSISVESPIGSSRRQVARVAGFASVRLDISDFPTRHPYGLGLWQNHIERILAGWVGELAVTFYRGREVTGLAQDDAGVDVELSDGQSYGPNISSVKAEDAAWSGRQPASSSPAGIRRPAA